MKIFLLSRGDDSVGSCWVAKTLEDLPIVIAVKGGCNDLTLLTNDGKSLAPYVVVEEIVLEEGVLFSEVTLA